MRPEDFLVEEIHRQQEIILNMLLYIYHWKSLDFGDLL